MVFSTLHVFSPASTEGLDWLEDCFPNVQCSCLAKVLTLLGAKNYLTNRNLNYDWMPLVTKGVLTYCFTIRHQLLAGLCPPSQFVMLICSYKASTKKIHLLS